MDSVPRKQKRVVQYNMSIGRSDLIDLWLLTIRILKHAVSIVNNRAIQESNPDHIVNNCISMAEPIRLRMSQPLAFNCIGMAW